MSKSKSKSKSDTPAPTAAAMAAPVNIGGQTFRRKMITLPQLKFGDGTTLRVKIDGPIVTSKVEGRAGKDGQKMKPADVCNVVNLETGEMATIICGTVLKNKLEESYENQSYVGKSFELTQHKVEGKRWRSYTIAELEAA